jgi:erythrin-vacuolar iron transport family protein
MTIYPAPTARQNIYSEPQGPFTPTQPEDDWGIEEPGPKWQIMPPIVTGGRLAAVKMPTPEQAAGYQNASIQTSTPQTPAPPTASQQEEAPLFRVSFFGQDQQWYSIKIGRNAGAVAQPALYPSWQQLPPTRPMSAGPDILQPVAALNAAQSQPKEEEAPRNVVLQLIQPGLVGLMDGSVSTLAPIFSVAFATHKPFITFLIGMASALGAGISMAFAEALSDDGDLTGRGNPFIRGGITGLMTFLSGAGHALPFLVSNFQIALFLAYAVVAVELITIAAIRHKFFGTNWWLSIVQVVGGGALVFAAALLLGNA